MTKQELRDNFIIYLKENYNYSKPEIMASNVFYAYNNDIGMHFLDIFASSSSMEHAKALLEKKFCEVKRKDPKGHTNVHYGCWVKFKEFIDKTYGGSIKIDLE